MKTNSKLAIGSSRLILFFMLCIFLTPLISSQVETLGSFKVKSCIDLKQTCSNCTYNNITSIYLTGDTPLKLLTERAMTKSGTEYNYTFCDTSRIGNYIVNGKGDVDGVTTVWAYDFNVSPTGFGNNIGFYFIILLISGIIIAAGFMVKDGWIAILGTIGLYLTGMFLLIYGIDGIRNLYLTRGLSFVLLGLASYISVNAGIEIIEEHL